MDRVPAPFQAPVAAPTRIFVGASIRCEQELFDAYCRSLRALHTPEATELSFAFVADCALEWPDDALVLPAPTRPADALYAVDEVTHRWQVGTFDHLARCKQLLLDHARLNGFDYVFLVDSDLLLEPTTLLSLYAARVDVISAVFYTAWQPGEPPLPQCWLAHPYDLAGLGMRPQDYMARLDRHEIVRVLGGGACTLLRTSTLPKLRYHPRLALPAEGMWQGEDRTLAVLAQQHRIKQYADAWPRVHHAYRPADREPADLDRVWDILSAPRQLFAKPGDWVSVRLTPMEDPGLDDALMPEVRNVRCRMGSGMLAPELEDALAFTQVGGAALVDVAFAEGQSVYNAGRRAIRMEVIDVRAA